MNTKQNNIGNIKNKYIFKNKGLKLKKYKNFGFNEEIEHMKGNCECCYFSDYDDYNEDDENEIYKLLPIFIDSCANNFYKIKYVKEIFNEKFLNNIVENRKYICSSGNSIIVPVVYNNLSDNYKKLVDRIIDDHLYNFNFEIIINFKDLTFNEVKKIDLRINNKYIGMSPNTYSPKRFRGHININLIKIKNNIKFYNNRSIEEIIEGHHTRKSDKVIFNDFYNTNSDVIFNYFIEDSKFIKNGFFKIKDLIGNKNNLDLLELYLF